MSPKDRVLDLIDDRIQFDDGCWMWTGPGDGQGYGRVSIKGRKYRPHRLVYEAFVGPIPDRHVVHHACENKLCVNPSHLQPVTRAAHMRSRRTCKRARDRAS